MRRMYEYLDYDELAELGAEIVNLEDDRFTLPDADEITGAVSIARALKQDRYLYKQAKEHYDELFDSLEDLNKHTACLALDLLFNKKSFELTTSLMMKTIMREFR